MNRPKTMKPQVETRTVTTDGTFEGFAEFLRSDNPADLVETELNYEHTLTDPRCDPEENEYETDGPHEFRLKKRKTTTVMETSPMGQPSSVGGEEQVVEDLVIHLSDSVREMFAGWTMSWKFAIDGYNGNGRESISDTPEGSRILSSHSLKYSETQHMDKTKRKRDEIEKPSEGLYCDDSDDDWDSDTEDVEPEKNATFKATIHVTGTSILIVDCSRRTYQAFIDYAVCGALYFAPLRSTYQVYCKALSNPAEENDQLPPLPLWPVWAEAYCTPYTIVPGFKTPSSPKSLYRLADMLIIPQLKAICRQQISNSIHVQNVISELQSSVFEQHEELRVDAYKFMRNTWHLYQSSEIVPFLANMSEAEAALVFNHILKNLPVSNSLLQPV
ncbi:uncharacterized protein MELLADRAFT_114660 [Melampsora larici-populina 98AG31]|uniref:BTB domain-containing protein n=1 Tax=Melampsora larici-populina (strain 98AG31 / pathotype 3-4-7) TaxID=747676 RepID=F4SEB1_MELLP|nr:uncharacterized protein MELLADRAFT_114660 [Melampsora larici-populina 98AG31]EGF97015.1 hypothetical protein MELLADRAFT_114660 [Melampsora larici-populina 98AG31]